MNTLKTIFVLLLLTISLNGCQKYNDDPEPEDFKALFSNTIWTGNFNNTGKPIQPISMAFGKNGDLVWYELSGPYPAAWTLAENKLTVSFPSGSRFTATVTNDQKLANIENGAANGWTLNNAELNTISDDVLDNTTWETKNLVINFLPGSLVNMTLGGGGPYPDRGYYKNAKTVHWDYPNYHFFMVRKNDTVYDGVNRPDGDPTIYPFQVIKK